jgi:hypothetical protein
MEAQITSPVHNDYVVRFFTSLLLAEGTLLFYFIENKIELQ